MSAKVVIDADGLILGRMASLIAKRLLDGEKIELVNAEKVVVSGDRVRITDEWKEFLTVGGFGKGPTHLRRPNDIVRRTVRGMLPYRIPKGKKAYGNLKVHIGVPEEFEKIEKQSLPEVHSSKLNRHFVTIGELAKSIGWSG
jgi:large subunit ribosomal protein L13